MTPTSQQQAEAASRRDGPRMEEVRPGLWALPSPMLGAPHIPFAFIWALRDPFDASAPIDLIDAGLDLPRNRDLFVEQLNALGATPESIRRVVVTHLHPDHTGIAEWLRTTVGAEVVMSATEARAQHAFNGSFEASRKESLCRWRVPKSRWHDFDDLGGRPLPPPPRVDRTLEHGDLIEVGDVRLKVVATPGHTAGHIVLVDEANRQIYSGDHVLPTLHPGIGLGGVTPTNPLVDFIASCEAMTEYATYEALPGHGYRFCGVATRAADSMAHHLRRAERVHAVLEQQPDASVWQIAEQLPWSAGWERLDPGFRFSALMQTEIFDDYVRNSRLG